VKLWHDAAFTDKEATVIDTSGLDKADVLAVLYNAACPHGMGFLQTEYAPPFMRRDDADKIIKERGDDTAVQLRELDLQVTRLGHHSLHFDYVYGRPMKVDLSKDIFEEKYYDGYHGAGHAAAAIAELRSTGQVMTDKLYAMHCAGLEAQVAKVLDNPETFSGFEREMGMGDHTNRLVSLARRALGGTGN
jgi:hypothetical protein